MAICKKDGNAHSLFHHITNLQDEMNQGDTIEKLAALPSSLQTLLYDLHLFQPHANHFGDA